MTQPDRSNRFPLGFGLLSFAAGWWLGFAQGFDNGQIVGASRVLERIARGVMTSRGR